MPSAPDWLRDKMEEYFGDRIDDSGPIKYLKEKGYKLTPSWQWICPDDITLQTMPEKEYHCVLFLVREWDFGGIANETNSP